MFELFWLATLVSPLSHIEKQQVDQGFRAFITLLHEVPVKQAPSMSEEEKKLYEPALALYLKAQGSKEAKQLMGKIKQENEEQANKHPEFAGINFLVALADANQEKWDLFFPRFYAAYVQAPKSYLAVRTEAVLQIKIFERARMPAEKKEAKEQVFLLAEEASRLNPQDTSLYKMRIQFAIDGDKKRVFNQVIHEIIQKNIMISRSDIPFYVAQAIDLEQKQAAYQFLNKAREWYDQSQVIERAEQFVKDHQWKIES